MMAQILYPESFTVILDTTKTIKGSITPELQIQTQKKLLVEISNLADLAMRFGENSITLANKIEFTKFGREKLLSGGYVYGKFRNDLDARLVLEYYSQVHWAEARGLERKYAAGAGARIRIVRTNKTGIFAGTGHFTSTRNGIMTPFHNLGCRPTLRR
ncbi:hypothetical protein JNM05_10545 [bacterium]|nr:hypothetical protein [bacterium]